MTGFAVALTVSPQVNGSFYQFSSETDLKRRCAYNFSPRFQMDGKIIGKLGKSLQDEPHTYKEACTDFNIMSEYKVNCLQTLLFNEAESFCIEYSFQLCNPQIKSFIFLFANQKNVDWHIQVKQYLQSSRINKIVAGNFRNFNEALKKLCGTIAQFTE